MKESKRISVLEELKQGVLTQEDAAVRMKVSVRQVRRISKSYQEKGIEGLVHGNRGKPNPRKTPEKYLKQAMSFIRAYYSDFGPVLAAEMLDERHGIKLSRELVRKAMIAEGLHSKKGKGVKHRSWRPPKERRGEMEQLDGSFHAWFEDRASKCWLLRFTDDATGEFMYGEFVTAESYKDVTKATIANFKKHGLPFSIYTDKGKVFRVNKGNDDGDLITQYERALNELNIELIHAHSPQAKGRVERNFKTDQNRLVKMLRLHNISTIDAANKYLHEVYIPKYNSKFARPAALPDDMLRPLNDINLYDIFCTREERKVRNDWTFQYYGRLFQVSSQSPVIVKPKDNVQIYERLDGSLFVKRGPNILSVAEIRQKPMVQREPKHVKQWRPGKSHPWKYSNSMFFEKKGHFHSAQ